MSGETMLSVEGVDAFYGGFHALWEVSLDVKRGEVVSLIGANGAGKTTTLNCISGLIKPAKGHIRYKGREIGGLGTHEIVSQGVSQVPEGRRISRI